MRNKHLNPLALIVYMIRFAKIAWFVLLPLLFQHLSILTVLIVLGIIVLYALSQYIPFTYSILPNELVIKSGLIVCKVRHIPYERIQSVQRKQWFYLRPFGIEELIIENASNSSEEQTVNLPAVGTSIAPELERRQLVATHHENDQPSESPKPLQYRIKDSDMFVFGITGVNVVAEFFVIIALLDRLNVALTPEIGRLKFLFNSITMIITSVVSVVIILMAIGVIKTFVRFYGFTVTKQADHLLIEKGLLQRKTYNIPLAKVQGVDFTQNIVRYWFHLTTVQLRLITNAKDDDSIGVVTIMPVIKQQQAFEMINRLTGIVPQQAPTMKRGDAYSKWLFVRNALLIALPMMALIMIAIYQIHSVVWNWAILGISALVIAFLIVNGIYKGSVTAVKQISADQVALQSSRRLLKRLTIVNWHQIQSVNYRQSIWMLKTKRAHLELSIRSGTQARKFKYRYLPQSDVQQIFEWYRDFVK
ncbi:PH domain-containing protein [Nicoliella lavandulae]|uniref:PH domain-containing protein n=1 Tax=Nicoliella lavandulae TaxID=3082954 RepID=A0ABU8SJE8_9LACO